MSIALITNYRNICVLTNFEIAVIHSLRLEEIATHEFVVFSKRFNERYDKN